MIKLPTVEYMMKLIKKYFGQENNPAFISDINTEILRINDPAKPEFPEEVKFIAKDSRWGRCKPKWFGCDMRPRYFEDDGTWESEDEGAKYWGLSDIDQILWLEHVNGNRPPHESLICLEEYK